MVKRNPIYILTLILVLTLVFTANIVSYGADDNVLRVKAYKPIMNLDPAHHVAEFNISLNLYSRLLKYKPGSSEVVPDAAEWVNVNKGGKEISFKLKEGIQFHKGYGELTAEDVKFSIERFVDPETNSEYANDWAPLDHVQVTGKYTGKIILKKPLAALLSVTLPYTTGNIISKKAFEEKGEIFATDPIGSGPYYFEEWVPNQELVLIRFGEYYGDLPDFSKIIVYEMTDLQTTEMAFDRGDLDVTEISYDSIERYKADPDVTVYTPTPLRYDFIGFNEEYPPFNNIKVRKAMRYAIDVDMILAGAFNNVPERASTMLPPYMQGYWADAPYYEVDIEKAKQLLKEAGYPDGFDCTMVSKNQPEHLAVTQIVQQNLKNIGVNVEIKMIEDASYHPYLGEESHPAVMFYDYWTLSLDPNYWAYWWTSEQIGKWNWLKWSNKKYDELVANAAVEMDEDTRTQMYVEMQKIMDKDAAMIWLTHGAMPYVGNSKVKPVFLGHYNQYRYWEKAE